MDPATIVALAAVGITVIGALIGVLIKVFVALQKNTDATGGLREWLDKQGNRIDDIACEVGDHGERIVVLETMHGLRGKVPEGEKG
jgi:mannose/fructose/N-acetylgalactosamine-specific phosphotransferase system component IID